MALKDCKECKKEISTQAKTCPHCGVENPGNKLPASKDIASFILVIFVVFFFYAISSNDSDDEASVPDSSPSAKVSNTEPDPIPLTPEQIAAEKEAKEKAERLVLEEKAKEEADCRKNIGCWGDKNRIAATFACDDHVERLSKFSYEWTDGFLELKFGHYQWGKRKEGIIIYIGDKIKFQNAFGAWQNIIYQCDYDPINEIVLDVRAEAGRL